MNFIGFDIGSSSIKASIIDEKGVLIAHEKYPDNEMKIDSPEKGWAEQNPEEWWENVCFLTKKMLNENQISSSDIKGIGISYQMHGLVLIDDLGEVLRPSIIWCDSRAVSLGNDAFNEIGENQIMKELLNSPGNFTASKLKWVKENEPEIYDRISKIMLPGDYIAYRFSNESTTTLTGLSEGVFWDFKKNQLSETILNHYGFSSSIFSKVVENFSEQCFVDEKGALESGLDVGTPIFYRAGDQPNNAFSLNVMKPGEIAATGGTSGVVYGVTDSIVSHEPVRINNFAHINYTAENPRIGKMLCINGAGIQYSWLKQFVGQNKLSYNELNDLSANVPVGSDGLLTFPFGNGAERVLNNLSLGASIHHLDYNRHKSEHLYRAGLEGIAFSFVYGMDILLADGLQKGIVKAGGDNLFRSVLFTETIAILKDIEIQIFDTTGSTGAARAAGIGFGVFDSLDDILTEKDILKVYHGNSTLRSKYVESYESWKNQLEKLIN